MKSPPKTSVKLDGVQFGRAVAAFMVVFYHAGRMLTPVQYLGHNPAAGMFFSFGNAGVDFFFTLSGFIIYYVHQGDIGRPSRFGHYLLRRVTRIYPMYWIATAIIVAVLILKRDWAGLAYQHVIKSVFLLPSPEEPLLGVGWTLMHEMLFYAVFAFAILSRPVGAVISAMWALLVLWGLYDDVSPDTLGFIQSPYHVEFAFGVLSAIALKRMQGARAAVALIVGLVVFATAALCIDLHWLEDSQAICRFIFGTSSALILFGVASLEMKEVLTFPGWAAFLGAASYSIYLFHTLAIGWLARVFFLVPISAHFPNIVFAAISTAAIIAGCAMYFWLERRVQSAVRRTASRSKDRYVPATG